MVKNNLLIKGLELFTQNGYKATTLEDVTSQINISKKTFYKYFDSKEEFIVEVIHTQAHYFTRLAKEWNEKSEDVIDYFFGFLKYSEQSSGFISQTERITDLYLYYKKTIPDYEQLTKQMFTDFMGSVIERGKKEGLIDKNIDEDVFLTIYANQYSHVRTCKDFKNPRNLTIDVFNQTYYIFFKAILNAEGMRRLEEKNYSILISE